MIVLGSHTQGYKADVERLVEIKQLQFLNATSHLVWNSVNQQKNMTVVHFNNNEKNLLKYKVEEMQ